MNEGLISLARSGPICIVSGPSAPGDEGIATSQDGKVSVMVFPLLKGSSFHLMVTSVLSPKSNAMLSCDAKLCLWSSHTLSGSFEAV